MHCLQRGIGQRFENTKLLQTVFELLVEISLTKETLFVHSESAFLAAKQDGEIQTSQISFGTIVEDLLYIVYALHFVIFSNI